MELTKEQIEEINRNAPKEWGTNEHGIFVQPYGVPVHIKEPVVYMRWLSGGYSGGSCWDDSDPQPFANTDKPKFKVLDLVLQTLKPDLTFLQFREIEALIKTNYETDVQYYGNSDEFEITYIPLSDLYNKLYAFE